MTGGSQFGCPFLFDFSGYNKGNIYNQEREVSGYAYDLH
jgi:hypothetical protein